MHQLLGNLFEKRYMEMQRNAIAIWQARLKNPRTLLSVWVFTALIFAVVKLVIGKYNNFKIFRHVFWHAIDGQTLYGPYPEYCDSNFYGILFSAVIAPFSLLPVWLGMILWVIANTVLLFYAIKQLPLTNNQKFFIYGYAYIELMTAQGVQQFNIAIAAFIILSFTFIQQKKDFLAAGVIVAGTLIKIYPIVGLAFLFFSKQKFKFILYCLLWAAIWFAIPILYTPGWDYVISQYVDWFRELAGKNSMNLFAVSQNISLLGVVRKISGNPDYNDLWLVVPGLILILLPYLRISQYKHLKFRLMLLANVLIFTVLFSTGSEASGYILVMVGIALWYMASPSPHQKYNYILLIVAFVIVGLSTTELTPAFIRKGFVSPYVLKAWPCILVWLTICYEMCFCDFKNYYPDNKKNNTFLKRIINSCRIK